jgi:hypothetical protein
MDTLTLRNSEIDRLQRHPLSRHLLEQIDRLGNGYRVERSFKFLPGRLLCNRFIVTIPFDYRLEDAGQTVLEICGALAMPDDYRAICAGRLSSAAKVHFGFEGDGDHGMLKAYLEFPYEHTSPNQEPWLLLLGLKWDPLNPSRCAVSRYVGLPTYTPMEIKAMTAPFFTDERFNTQRSIVNAILMLCDRRAADLGMWYLDVTEEGNPRRSFDIKTYRARILIGDVVPLFLQLFDFYNVPFKQYEQYFATIMKHKFGHLSCGIGRDGNFFMAIYHEAPGQ